MTTSRSARPSSGLAAALPVDGGAPHPAHPERAVQIYTDGACKGNPGPGGWGALMIDENGERELFGAEPVTTNNRMELQAVIEALRILPEGTTAVVHTDSQYVQQGISSWIHNWKRRGWRTSDGKPVKNVELWQALEREAARHRVAWRWVRGHAGHTENERADALANRGISEAARARPAARPGPG
jgi:ribonuclease HI